MDKANCSSKFGYLPEYITSALTRSNFSRRKYQELASLNAINLLQKGINVEINLPPGTGKTLISQIISVIWMRESDQSRNKVLCIVPSSALRSQHYQYSWWAEAANLCTSLEITPNWLRRTRIPHRDIFEEKNFWFALPESFFNAYHKGYINYETLDKVGLVIIDEYDAFSIGVLRAEGNQLQFTKDYERLTTILDVINRRYLLMSATPAINKQGPYETRE